MWGLRNIEEWNTENWPFASIVSGFVPVILWNSTFRVSTTVSLAGLSDVSGAENSVPVANAPKIIHTLSTHTSSMLLAATVSDTFSQTSALRALMNLNTYTWFKRAKSQPIEHHPDSAHLLCGGASLLKPSRKELFVAVRIMSFQGKPRGSAAICSKMIPWVFPQNPYTPKLSKKPVSQLYIYSWQSIVDARVQIAMTSKIHPANIEYINVTC